MNKNESKELINNNKINNCKKYYTNYNYYISCNQRTIRSAIRA